MSNQKTSTLNLYFKSGNVVTIDSVVEGEVKRKDGKITEISLTQRRERGATTLIINSIDILSLDCITETH
jgi:hypothetical protein